MLFRPVSEFVRASAYLQAGKVGVFSVFSIFENTEPLPEPENPLRPKERAGAVEFQNVSFRYNQKGRGLSNFSLKVKPGQKILIVGPSGSGKSTLFNLMMRLYDCDKGTITLDGINVRRLRREDLQNYFSVIPQDQLHMEDTLLANIMLDEAEADPTVRMDKALELSQKLDMDQLLTSRHKKYGEQLETGSMAFSRGELQKLAMMRAAAKVAPIILMDEPTSALDEQSQRMLLEFANEVFAGKTVFMIAHQPHPLFKADWIVVLKSGVMVDQGNHHYLLKNCAFYRQLSHRRARRG
jgi:ABC-type multidrug transport system fused ATPase/permease subunit